ncbi:hypothetical protein GR160_06550 [Flavobacterium sp. Sd200]|uniref:gliding motility-associated C-terminal domain-containing protein n=1 Tax=Flavobacterium sp. Sd200 TaxID=2692211 RepID=UPI00137176A8|nr:gliding motility-associated C-terminal domain-containing protein [Flavobacterium sp. Sd200]MXN90883.1 hypothetical protein [Flavobacterium sp. Sd200]
MKQPLQTKSLFAALLLFLVTLGASAQLSVTATVTNEGCPGTGALAFVLGGATPGGTVSYAVTGPDGVTTNVTAASMSNLVAGTYTIVATQTVAGVTTTATTTATINETALTPQPSYSAIATPASCPGTGAITMNILVGSPVGLVYEITSPVTRPQQASPTFTGLDAGTYNVRMTDFCGRETDVTVIISNAVTNINILAGVPVNPPVPLPDCNHIFRMHTIPAFTSLNYPLTFTYTVTNPSGVVLSPPIVQTIAGGLVAGLPFVTPALPYFEGQQYSYELVATDRCGNVIGTRNTVVNEEFEGEAVPNFGHCLALIDVTLNNVTANGPFHVNFISFPAGFDPAVANPMYPNFDSPSFSFGNTIPYYEPGGDITVPNGTYVMEVTNTECPDHGTITLTVVIERILPYDADFTQVTPCGGPGAVTGTVVNPAPGNTNWNQTIPTAIMITSAVPGLPANQLNRTGDINPLAPHMFTSVLPLGTYEFTMTDECGNTYVKTVVVEPNMGGADLTDNQRPGCGEGDGSIMIFDELLSLNILGGEIVDGPPAFRAANPVLPVNIDANVGPNGLNPDVLYINSLPEGDYVFNVRDVCGTQEYRTTIVGYHFDERTAVINREGACNSFTVTINDQGGNNETRAIYFLQKEVSPGVWGHPQTGAVYVPGTALNSTNAINFNDAAFSGGVDGITTNLATWDVAGTSASITGVNSPNIRVIQSFNVYGNGTAVERCINTVSTFSYTGAPEITNVITAPCSSGGNEVVVIAQGVTNLNPLRYSITAPITVPEQTSNIFTGLQDGVAYTFQVRDDCSTGTEIASVTPGGSLAITQNGVCPGLPVALEATPYPFLTYNWHLQGSTVSLGTTSTLSFNPYDPATHDGIYEVDVTFPLNPTSCLNQTLTYTLIDTPVNAGADFSVPTVCSDAVTTFTLTDYLSTDAQTGGTFAAVTALPTGATVDINTGVVSGLTAAGAFDFTYTITSACGFDDATITINITETPALPTVTTLPIQCEGSTFSLTAVSTTPGVTYEWTLPNTEANVTVSGDTVTFTSAIIANTGSYSVVAVSADGACRSASVPVTVTVTAMPNAGNGQTANICNTATGTIEMLESAAYLGASFDANGTWTDISAVSAGAQFDPATGAFDTAGLFGQFQFRYEVSACGTSDDTIVTINLNPTPATPVITPALLIVCANGTVQIDTPAVTGATYTWTLPNAATVTTAVPQLVISNADPATHNGAYSLVVTVNGCPSVAGTTTVTVTPLPAAGIDGNDTICTTASSATLILTNYLGAAFDTAATPNTASAVWTLVSATAPLTTEFDAANGTFATANLAGTFVFKYTVTSTCGATDDADVTITLNATPAQPVATVTNAVVCEGSAISLSTAVVAGATYQWYKNTVAITGAASDTYTIATSALADTADYTVTVTVNGCISDPSANVGVTVTAIPQFTVAADNPIVCPGQPTTIRVTPVNFDLSDSNINYTWSVDGVVDTTLTGGVLTNVTTTEDVVYAVVITDTNGSCQSAPQSTSLTIDRDPFTVVLQADCINNRLILQVANIDEIGATREIKWSGPGLSETGNESQVDITGLTENATYTATVTNVTGCVKDGNIDVERTTCMIPRGISPDNADDKNDVFDLTYLNVENLQIFNRYGLQVYEKSNYTKEWFGQSDKGDLPTGTYFYVLKMADKQITGWVYVQRNN